MSSYQGSDQFGNVMSKHLIIQSTYTNILNHTCADLQLMCAWLLSIIFVVEVGVCVCVCARTCVCACACMRV